MSRFCFYAGLFCVTAATLMLQLIQTRILSLVAWYHLAFFVISTAMFGLTAGAVWIYLRGSRYTAKTLTFDLAHYSALMPGCRHNRWQSQRLVDAAEALLETPERALS